MSLSDYFSLEQAAEVARLRAMQSGLWPRADGSTIEDWRELSWEDVSHYTTTELRFLGERMSRDIHERRRRERLERA